MAGDRNDQERRWSLAVTMVLASCLGPACFDSHSTDGAGWPPSTPPPGEYEIDPAPGEGTICPALPVAPPGCAVPRGGGFCDAAALGRALAGASRGDVVLVGRCRVVAALSVPPGVTLAGVDRAASVVVAPLGQPAISLRAESSASVARCLTVEANGVAAVMAAGPGEARVEYATILAPTGVGVSAEGVGRVSLHGLEIIGPVNRSNADAQPLEPTPDAVGTVGAQLIDVGEATLYGVTIAGFASAGLLAAESPVTVRGLVARENLGVGALYAGAPACVRRLSVEDSMQGTRLIPTYGVVLADGAEFHGAEVSVVDSEGYGILGSDSLFDVEGLLLERNAQGGLWAQGGGHVAIRGPGTLIDGNGTAGVYVCGAGSVDIAGAEISRTESRVRVVGSMPVELGAGIVVGAVPRVRLSELQLADNETAGLILDLGAASSAEIEEVFVTGTGSAFGAVAFDEAGWLGVGGWDVGVTRDGATVANDARGGPGEPGLSPLGCAAPGL